MSNESYQETEVKLYVPELQPVQERLQTLGATLAHERVYERNVRYEDNDETLTPQGIVVRLREDSRVRLTYKGAKTMYKGIGVRDEYEVEVSDFDAMEIILYKLGYHAYLVYEKYRTTYSLYDAEIVLDEMPYGNFVEIEGTIETIEKLVAELDLNKAPRIENSYSTLFEIIKQHLDIDVRDLTFDNFAGYGPPSDAFFRQW